MSLRTILSRLAADAGYNVVTQRAYVLDNINAFARDLHDNNDLTWCDREEIFVIDYTKERAALPWRVMTMHAARDADTNFKVSTVGLGPRYKIGTWRNIISQYRIIKRSPIKRDMLSGGKLYIHLVRASESDIMFAVVGKTTSAGQQTEEIVVPAGTIVMETEEVYEDIFNLEKQAICDVDMFVSTSDDPENEDAVLAEIPNHQLSSSYLIVQHSDFYLQRSQNMVLEVWYKHKFVPFVSDYDNFVCTDIYDNAIYLGAWGRILAKTTDKAAEGVAMIDQAIKLALSVSAKERESQDEELPTPDNIVDRAHEMPNRYMMRAEETYGSNR